MTELLKNIDLKKHKSFINFFLTGVFGASVNFLSQIPLKIWFLDLGMNQDAALAWSVFWAYMISTAATFIPAKIFAFSAKESGNSKREWVKFFMIASLALIVQELVTLGTLKFIVNPFFEDYSLLWREKASHLAGMACSFLANFFGHKFFTFRTTGLYNFLRPQKN